jgi:hypothetical protein
MNILVLLSNLPIFFFSKNRKVEGILIYLQTIRGDKSPYFVFDLIDLPPWGILYLGGKILIYLPPTIIGFFFYFFLDFL